MSRPRLLFASIHGYLDPSGGAAICTREMLELLAARGWDCRSLTCGVLDYQRETTVDELLASLGLDGSARRRAASLESGGRAEVVDLEVGGVRVTMVPTASSRPDRAPAPHEGAAFLDLAGQVLKRFRPQVLLTYGGHPVGLELMRRAARPARPSSSTCTTSATATAAGSPTSRRSFSPRSIRGGSTGTGSAWTGP